VSLGIAGDYGNEKLQDACRKMVSACQRNGIWPGIAGLSGDDQWARYIALGAKFVQVGADFGFMMAAGTQQTSFLNGLPVVR
jgi:2-keto-3-deoxy-L-rhamnonate aldolase RhmA